MYVCVCVVIDGFSVWADGMSFSMIQNVTSSLSRAHCCVQPTERPCYISAAHSDDCVCVCGCIECMGMDGEGMCCEKMMMIA